MSIASTLSNIGSDLKKGFADSYPHAIYRLLVNGTDIGTIVQDRLIRMQITDNRGIESDSIEIELSDHDGLVEIPPKGAEIEAWIGWSNTGLVYKGKYTINELEHSGTPDVLRLRGMGADLKKSLKQKKERSFIGKTLSDIITSIALEHGLIPKIHASLAQRQIPHLDQNESDANLVTRLADEHDAIATVKNGHLLFTPIGISETTSSLDLPTIIITRTDGDQHRYSEVDEGEEITGVKAYYYDAKLAKKLEVIVGDQSNQNIKELRHIHRDKQSAELAARAKFNMLKRTAATFSYSLAYGDPELIPEMKFLFIGLKEQIDDIYWLGTNIIHTLDESGFTTKTQFEKYIPDADDLSELFEDQFELEKDKKWTGVVVYYQQGNKAVPLTKGDQANPKHFTYLYVTKEAAQQRLDREYSLLDLETGQFKAHNTLDVKPYTGVKTMYTIKAGNTKTRHVLTKGDQSNPKYIGGVYQTKKAAEKALARELPRIIAKKDMVEKIKQDQ